MEIFTCQRTDSQEIDIRALWRDSNPQSQQASGRKTHALHRAATGIDNR